MGLFIVLGILATSHLALRYYLSPVVENRWRASSNTGKVAQASAVAGVKTLTTFTQIALVVLGVFTIVMAVLTVVSPLFAGAALINLHAGIDGIDRRLNFAKGFFENGALWIALSGLFYFSWRAARGDIRRELQAQRSQQLHQLIETAQSSGLDALPPTKEMTQGAAVIEAIDKRLGELESREPANLAAEQQRLGQLRVQVEQQILAHDLDRRIDLTDTPVVSALGRGLWPSIRVVLLSKSAVSSVSELAEWSGHIATAAACLLLIGVSTPVAHALGVLPILDKLSELQLAPADAAAKESLARLVQAPLPPPPPEPDPQSNAPSNAQVYHIAAQHFVQALAHSNLWDSGTHSALGQENDHAAASAARDSFNDVEVRDLILRTYAADPSGRPTPGVQHATVDTSSDPDLAKRYTAYQQAEAPGITGSALSDDATRKVEHMLAVKAQHSPAFYAHVRRGVEDYLHGFSQPATVWDLSDVVVGRTVDTALMMGGLPNDAGLYVDTAADIGGDTAHGAAKRVVRQQLVAFMDRIAGGYSYQDALAAVRAARPKPGEAVFTRAESQAIRSGLDQAEQDRDAIVQAATSSPPSLVEETAPDERQAVKEVVSTFGGAPEAAEEKAALRGQLEGAFGSYEDLFPGQARNMAATAIGDALGDVAAGADAVLRARNFLRLAGSFRLGGVLIGVNPVPGGPRPDYRRLVWRVQGRQVSLALIDGQGQALQLGSYPGSLVQEALAYAADGRQTTTTMTKGPFTGPILRVHVHPALLNTATGCTMIGVDRFVDESSGNDPMRGEWDSRVALQLAAYNAAVARAASASGSSGDNAEDAKFTFRAAASDLAHGKTKVPESAATAFAFIFPASWNPRDPQQSVFAYHRQRFDQDLVARLVQCRSRLNGDESDYWRCAVGSGVNTKAYTPQEFQPWSGVRETAYGVSPSSFASDVSLARGTGTTRPLRFMDQIAFAREAEQAGCDGDECTGALPPWEFPVLGGLIQQRVEGLVARSPSDAALLRTARDFALLQRVFRAGLGGWLGPRFNKADLVALMVSARAAEPIEYVPTPTWSQQRRVAVYIALSAREETDELRRGIATAALVAAGKSADSDAASGLRACAKSALSSIDSGDYGSNLAGACHGVDSEALGHLKSAWSQQRFLQSLVAPGSSARFAGETCRGHGG